MINIVSQVTVLGSRGANVVGLLRGHRTFVKFHSQRKTKQYHTCTLSCIVHEITWSTGVWTDWLSITLSGAVSLRWPGGRLLG